MGVAHILVVCTSRVSQKSHGPALAGSNPVNSNGWSPCPAPIQMYPLLENGLMCGIIRKWALLLVMTHGVRVTALYTTTASDWYRQSRSQRHHLVPQHQCRHCWPGRALLLGLILVFALNQVLI